MPIRYQKGQAISEFIVAMVWMVPFFLAFIAIAQMLNAQSTTHEAARYVAWERLALDDNAYRQRLAGGVNGFDAQVTNRFFINGGTGFGTGDSGVSRDWDDWKSKQDVVDTVQGVQLTLADDRDDVGENQQRLSGLLRNRSGDLTRMSDRGDVELDTSSTAVLSIPVNVDGNSAFSGGNVAGDLKLSASYALIADSWAAGSEDNFSERVEGFRPGGLSNARTWLQNQGGARRLRNVFKEIDLKLYSDPDSPANSFSTISPEQSTALPPSLLEEYVE
ncbi:pilus assembly protein [Ketobacter sp. MCCC 1A13808]|uniref:TadE family protein n=1 Tax=Ketobacter sp. MCCC 1A13808 TaxID=2602738 RepID=UPI0012EC24B1|nr:TadE family protein [Ketobacter sp. MCCC 1A13808]MVF12534.1 pilus assembly protein [Ketobacter sp. MCCC 1A13808]